MNNKTSFIKDNIAHLSVIAVGALIMLLGCFQSNLWFDEAYTVALARHSLIDMIKLATFDVHPHLYYIMLKLFTMVFGDSCIAMRIFSAIGGILFASLGLTHIKKDFGNQVGFWFSFFAVFSASTLIYALQIRMYTWAAFFVTLTAIYAYRSFALPQSRKNRILFLLCSVSAAYTHYFALFAVAIINIFLLCRYFKEKRSLKIWWQNAAVQIGCYIPGLLVFLKQISLDGAAWISIEWPNIIFDFTSYHLLGEVLDKVFARGSDQYSVAGGISLALYVAGGIFLWNQAKTDKLTPKTKKALSAALWCYFGTVLFALTVSLFRAIYYARYTVVICGLLFFALAVLVSSFKRQWLKGVAAVVMIFVFATQAVNNYMTVYDASSDNITDSLDPYVSEGDKFLIERPEDYVLTVNYAENDVYFFNWDHWTVQDAYSVFGEDTVMDDLDCPQTASLGNRVWVAGRDRCFNYLLEEGYTEAAEFNINVKYHDQSFTVILMVK